MLLCARQALERITRLETVVQQQHQRIRHLERKLAVEPRSDASGAAAGAPSADKTGGRGLADSLGMAYVQKLRDSEADGEEVAPPPAQQPIRSRASA